VLFLKLYVKKRSPQKIRPAALNVFEIQYVKTVIFNVFPTDFLTLIGSAACKKFGMSDKHKWVIFPCSKTL